MKRRHMLLVGLSCLLLSGLNSVAGARGGGHGGGAGHQGGSGTRSYVAPAPKTAAGSRSGYGRRGWGRGGRGGGYGYYGDDVNGQQPVSAHFESSHFSGPDHISPAQYSHFVKTYSWPSASTAGIVPASTTIAASSQATH